MLISIGDAKNKELTQRVKLHSGLNGDLEFAADKAGTPTRILFFASEDATTPVLACVIAKIHRWSKELKVGKAKVKVGDNMDVRHFEWWAP
jgi:hypothetical protein